MRWVILRLQLETIKLTDREYSSINVNPYYSQSNNMAIGGGGGGGGVEDTRAIHLLYAMGGCAFGHVSGCGIIHPNTNSCDEVDGIQAFGEEIVLSRVVSLGCGVFGIGVVCCHFLIIVTGILVVVPDT